MLVWIGILSWLLVIRTMPPPLHNVLLIQTTFYALAVEVITPGYSEVGVVLREQ